MVTRHLTSSAPCHPLPVIATSSRHPQLQDFQLPPADQRHGQTVITSRIHPYCLRPTREQVPGELATTERSRSSSLVTRGEGSIVTVSPTGLLENMRFAALVRMCCFTTNYCNYISIILFIIHCIILYSLFVFFFCYNMIALHNSAYSLFGAHCMSALPIYLT